MAKKNLSKEDSDLFRQAIGKVRTVKSDKVALTPDKKPKPYPKVQTVDVEGHLNSAVELVVDKLDIEDTFNFLAPGLQHSVLKKLRKKQFGLDAEIDLHGLTSVEAKRQLLHFLHDCVENGHRCVHIVHGKGYRSTDNRPILKNNLNLWLRQHQDVQAFCSAPQRDGGAGAVFVLLQVTAKFDESDY